jgi:NADPH-dependent curcumin reductase CurA
MSGQMKKGESVLIHAGSGGVGQAAINICLHTGCTVFTTVGTEEKREFIKKQFPQVAGINNVHCKYVKLLCNVIGFPKKTYVARQTIIHTRINFVFAW